MKTVRVILAALLLAASSFAADLPSFAKGNGDFEIDYQAIPASVTTVVVTGTVHLTNLYIFAASNTPSVTVSDMHGTPLNLISFATANGTGYFLPPGIGIRCTGGITVTSSASGAYMYMSFKP